MTPSIPSISTHSAAGVSGGTVQWVPVFVDGQQVFANGRAVMVPIRLANA